MAIGDIYEVAIVGAQTGSVIVSTLNYRTTISIGPKLNEMLALAEQIHDVVVPELAGLCSEQLTWDTIRIRDVHDNTAGVDRSVAISGVGISQAMPKQISALVNWYTGFIGRSARGRLYLPAVEEAQWDGDAWVSTYLAGITDFAETIRSLTVLAFPDPLDSFAWEHVVYSDLLDLAREVISFGVSPNPATQRRRKSGVGV